MKIGEHWQGRERFAVFDSCYGDGARFRALVEQWRADPARPDRLHVIALDRSLLPGFHRILQDDQRITLDLLSAPIDDALAQVETRFDAIVLHGLGDTGVRWIGRLRSLANHGALLSGHALDAIQLKALEAVGFALQDGEGAGAIGAVFTRRQPPPAPVQAGERRAIVVGAGLAGAAACERLCARGWHVTLVERHPQAAAEASGNLAGIFMPLLSRDDNIPTRLARAAYLFALRYWERIGGIGGAIEGARCGVLQLARDPAHAEVQRAIAAAHLYPHGYAEWIESAAASALLGSSAPDGAWLFPQAGWAHPASVCAAMLAACGALLECRFGTGSVQLCRVDQQWQVLDADGALLAEAPTLILANGAGATALAPAAHLPLAAVRGQVTHLAAGAVRALPFVLCREAYLAPASGGIHSLGASYDSDAGTALRRDSQAANLDKIRSMLGDREVGADAPLLGRVGFRCMAPDRLPLAGALPEPAAAGACERLRDLARQPGLYGLLGYASRGLVWAPLAAELLAAQLSGEPLPLETKLAAALDPGRFLLRARRRGNSPPA